MDDFPTLYPIPKDLKKFIECENYSTYDEQNDNGEIILHDGLKDGKEHL
jgi:hypothetical protein